MNYYVECIKKYVVFSGRARRKEYWMFVLFNCLIFTGIGIICGIVGTSVTFSANLANIYSLGMLLPGLAVSSRRLHDTDRSALWLLLGFVPFIGGIVLFIFMCLDSTPGENRFGPNPKGA